MALHYPGFAVDKEDENISLIHSEEPLLTERFFVDTKENVLTIDFMIHTSTMIHRCIISFKVSYRFILK